MANAYIQGRIGSVEYKQTSGGKEFANLTIHEHGAKEAIPVSAWRDVVADLHRIPEGTEVHAVVRIKGREWNGRTFADVELLGATPMEATAPERTDPPARREPTPAPTAPEPDDATLPF